MARTPPALWKERERRCGDCGALFASSRPDATRCRLCGTRLALQIQRHRPPAAERRAARGAAAAH